MSEWISLDDRLPSVMDMRLDHNGFYCILIADREGWDIHGYSDPDLTLVELKAQRARHEITHWMPLPDLPSIVQTRQRP